MTKQSRDRAASSDDYYMEWSMTGIPIAPPFVCLSARRRIALVLLVLYTSAGPAAGQQGRVRRTRISWREPGVSS